jgi:hypothetical protein
MIRPVPDGVNLGEQIEQWSPAVCAFVPRSSWHPDQRSPAAELLAGQLDGID